MVVVPAIGFAQLGCSPTNPAGCTAPAPTFVGAIQKILNLFFWVILFISVIFLMIAAYTFITGGGDPEAMGKAMTSVRNAVIGLVIAVLARGLAMFAANFFS